MNDQIIKCNEQEAIKRICKTIADKEQTYRVIAQTNKQTLDWNLKIKYELGRKDILCVGDKLVCTQNNVSALNGEIFTVNAVGKTHRIAMRLRGSIEEEALNFIEVELERQNGEMLSTYIIRETLLAKCPGLTKDQRRLLIADFNKRKGTDNDLNDRSDLFINALRVRYGYCITCHKAQGSEAEIVYIDTNSRFYEQKEKFRWLYTAASRAQKAIVLI